LSPDALFYPSFISKWPITVKSSGCGLSSEKDLMIIDNAFVDSMFTKTVLLTNYFLRELFDRDDNEQEDNLLWMTVGNDHNIMDDASLSPDCKLLPVRTQHSLYGAWTLIILPSIHTWSTIST
jgi:hypothetical protein